VYCQKKALFVIYCQLSTFISGGDLAKAQHAVLLLRPGFHLDYELDLIDARLAFIYWYVVSGGRENFVTPQRNLLPSKIMKNLVWLCRRIYCINLSSFLNKAQQVFVHHKKVA
jgi:hypothetical protein